MRNAVIYLLCVTLLCSSCCRIFAPKSTVTIKSSEPINEPVTITTTTKKGKINTYENVRLPYDIKVKNTRKVLPLKVSIESESYNYESRNIYGEVTTFSIIELFFWMLTTTVSWIGPLWVANNFEKPMFKSYTLDATPNVSKFSVFAKQYVQERINEWQKKGEYEKLSHWQTRVNENTRQQQAAIFLADAEKEFIQKHKQENGIPTYQLSRYDAESETYKVTTELGEMLVNVPINEAQAFAQNWNSVSKTPSYRVVNDKIALSECKFTTPQGKTYRYDNQEALTYRQTNINYNFAPIDIEVASNNTPVNRQQVSSQQITLGSSDVDLNIPETSRKNKNTFAVIIANENYRRAESVEFARNDGESFRKYCIKTLGIPEKNIEFRPDATLNDLVSAFDWIDNIARSYKGEASIVVYYAGHGIPDEATGDAYLLPADGIANNPRTAYALSELYSLLGKMPARLVTVFLDACFSGAQRDGEMLASARGVVIKSKATAPKGNMVVFSAAQGDETAYPYRDKQHGLFTYYLLKKLQESNGNATFEELSRYITDNVGKTSITENRKTQTPTVYCAPALIDKWKELQLK